MESKPLITLFQFGTGTPVNLLPLAAGQLVSRLRQEKDLLEKYTLNEIVFRREDPGEIGKRLGSVAIAGFSCFLWNTDVSLKMASEIRRLNPNALIVVGGPSIPKDFTIASDFFHKNPAIDVICTGEGENVFVDLCKEYSINGSYKAIPGILYREGPDRNITATASEVLPNLEILPSPFLDGTFDSLYEKFPTDFSGICWETNRGCPYECSYCTWGNLPSRKMRSKPMNAIKEEITWMGTHKVKYVSMADSNFGIMPRDVEIAELLGKCKAKTGYPQFISVSWAKQSTDRVISIGRILKEAGIGFRVTLSLQTLNPDVAKTIKRSNYDENEFHRIKALYHLNNFYSYAELILGLPLETYSSFLSGIERILSESVFEQIYIYPLFLFPNTLMAHPKSRDQYGLESRFIPNRYTKSKETGKSSEVVEIVVGTSAMPKGDWRNSFIEGYFTLALHDDRLAFFIFRYLKREFGTSITQLVAFSRIQARKQFPGKTIDGAFTRFEETTLSVQKKGSSHLIEPLGYDGIPFDPPDAVFLEIILELESFYDEFKSIVYSFLIEKNLSFQEPVLEDLFQFQKAVIARPAEIVQKTLELRFDWISYFGFTFGLDSLRLAGLKQTLTLIDPAPSFGNPLSFLKNHFEIRGVPSFNELYRKGQKVFPPKNPN